MKLKKKIKHLKKYFGFKDEELTEIVKMYSFEFFNPHDLNYLRLLKISSDLSSKYNELSCAFGCTHNIAKKIKIYFEKKRILKLLFIKNIDPPFIRFDIKAVIGLVEIKGNVFININTTFNPTSMIYISNNVAFANRITVGEKDFTIKKGKLVKLSKIYINKYSWICTGTNIFNDVKIGKHSVIAAGTCVDKNINDNYLAVGIPCINKSLITKELDKNENKPLYILNNADLLILERNIKRNIKFIHFNSYLRVLRGEKFNALNFSLARLFTYTHVLCDEYNAKVTTLERKKEILNILFPLHGENFQVGNKVFIDLLGTVIVKDNVTLKDNVSISGNVLINSNVTIENNVSLFATDHELYYKKRRVNFNLAHGMHEYSCSKFIIIKEGIEIKKNSIIVAPNEINKNIIENSLVTKKKILNLNYKKPKQ